MQARAASKRAPTKLLAGVKVKVPCGDRLVMLPLPRMSAGVGAVVTSSTGDVTLRVKSLARMLMPAPGVKGRLKNPMYL